MDRNTIMKLAREHDLHCYGRITEQSLYSEIIVEFAAAIRSAVKDEDAKICENHGFGAEEWLPTDLADAIRASK